MKSIGYFPRFSVEYLREEIPVEMISPSKVPDEEWRFVDMQGHGHFWDGEKLPTLKWVVTGTQWIGDEYDGDEYDVGEYRCTQCGETIEPDKKIEHGSRSIPGPTWMIVTVEEEEFRLTPEQYAKSMQGWLKSLRKIGQGG